MSGFVVRVRCRVCGASRSVVAFGVRSRTLVLCPSCGHRGWVSRRQVRSGRPFVRPQARPSAPLAGLRSTSRTLTSTRRLTDVQPTPRRNNPEPPRNRPEINPTDNKRNLPVVREEKKVAYKQLTFAPNQCPSSAGDLHLKVAELPEKERPVRRLIRYSETALSTAEIIAAILQTPNALEQAHMLLAKFGGLMGIARASINDLCEVPGIGEAKAAQLKAALEISRRLLVDPPDDKPQVKSPADAANLLMLQMETLQKEHMVVIVLDTKSHVIAQETISIGTVNANYVRVAEVFQPAIKANAPAIIVAHNHPSGDPTPSPEDVMVTELITEAGDLLDIQVLDHLVIGQNRYVSLKERGLGGFD